MTHQNQILSSSEKENACSTHGGVGNTLKLYIGIYEVK
jgi:hypothetical protein